MVFLSASWTAVTRLCISVGQKHISAVSLAGMLSIITAFSWHSDTCKGDRNWVSLAGELAICNFLLPLLTSNILGGTPPYQHPYIRTVSLVVINQISTNPKLLILPHGVVRKKDGIWCLITDISSLLGSSIYHYIPKKAFTLTSYLPPSSLSSCTSSRPSWPS